MVILYPAAWLKIEFVGKIGVKLTEPTDSENESKDVKDQETGEAASKVDARAASVIFATFTAFLTTGLKQTELNVTPLIRRGSNFYFFEALDFALFDLLPCLQARGTRDCK